MDRDDIPQIDQVAQPTRRGLWAGAAALAPLLAVTDADAATPGRSALRRIVERQAQCREYHAVEPVETSAQIGQRGLVRTWSLADLSASQMQNMTRSSNLLAPVGVKAARFVAENHGGQAPVLNLMIPRSASEKLQWPAGLERNTARVE